jgi:lysophospholipase
LTDIPLIPAPFFADIADGPGSGSAYWLRAGGMLIRAAVWPEGAAGTVLLFPGRTEYAEKYGRAASDLQTRGYATVAIDWRGQGLADRALPDRMIGHVEGFAGYQADITSVMRLVGKLGLPKPLYLLAHSMGGCIGLRALMLGLPVRAAVFSAPMWGIAMPAWKRPLALTLACMADLTGQARRYAPGTSARTYLAEAGFGGNVLTTDPDMWMYMKRQITLRPELALAGPSLGWLHQAFGECAALSRMPAPHMPCVTWLGGAERVVDAAPIHLRMSGWQLGQTRMMPGAEHEIMMETPARRATFFDSAVELFRANP